MEFWFRYNKEKVRLPIPPPNFSMSRGKKVEVVEVANLGEIALLGNVGLMRCSISSFFPNQVYTFCQYSNFPKPYEFVELFMEWQEKKKPIRFFITDTNINMLCTIENFTYTEQDGTRDVYFTLDLVEYRQITVSKVKSQSKSSVKTSQSKQKRAVRSKPTLYTVKVGDTLYGIAKRLYGDGSKYTVLASANKIKDVNKIKVGMELIVP